MKYLNSKTILSAFLLASFSGCVGGMNISSKQDNTIPKWYLNTPSNTAVYLYGEGEGNSIKEAKNNALNAMASRLIVSVESSIQTVTTVSHSTKKNSYSKDITKDLKVEVQKIKFTNAKVKQISENSGKVYVLMQVDRKQLFQNNKKEFDILDNRVTTQYNSSKSLSKLEQIGVLETLYPYILKAKQKAVVLNAIDNSFDHSVYISKYDSYIDKINQLKDSATINVTTNLHEKYFADAFIDLLNQNHYKISSKSDITIKLTNKVKYSKARGWNIAKVSTTISVISSNKIISNRVITTVGQSSTSKESALESASKRFIKKIKKLTLDKVIFSR